MSETQWRGDRQRRLYENGTNINRGDGDSHVIVGGAMGGGEGGTQGLTA